MGSIVRAAVVILALTSSIGCAAQGDAEENDQSEAAATAEIRSLNDQNVRFGLAADATPSGLDTYAVVEKTPVGIELRATRIPLLSGFEYSLTAEGRTAGVGEVPTGAPKNIVDGGTPRIALFVHDKNGNARLLRGEGVPFFQTIAFKGDTATFATVTFDGKRRTGTIPMPGLADGTTSYSATVVPRDVSKGSILGTHFFRMKMTSPK